MKTTNVFTYVLIIILCMPSHLAGAQAIPSTSTPEKKSFWSAKKVALAVGAALTTIASVAVGVGYKVSQSEKRPSEKEVATSTSSSAKEATQLTKEESDFINRFDALPHEIQIKIFEELVKSTPAYDLNRQVKIYSQVSQKFNEIAHSSPALRAIKSKEYSLDDITRELKLNQKKGINISQDINSQASYDGKTALHIAAEYGNPKIVEILLTAGAQVDLPDYNRETPFMLAVYQQHYKNADLLLEWGADINHKNFWGDTALLHLSLNADLPPVLKGIEYLLSKGARTDIVNAVGRTPYDMALSRYWTDENKLEKVEELFLRYTLKQGLEESLPRRIR